MPRRQWMIGGLFVLVFLWATPLTAVNLVQIRVAHGNAREEAQAGSTVKAVLNQGEIYPVEEDVPYWYGITLRNGETAYVSKSLCKVVDEEEGENPDEEAGSLSPSCMRFHLHGRR